MWWIDRIYYRESLLLSQHIVGWAESKCQTSNNAVPVSQRLSDSIAANSKDMLFFLPVSAYVVVSGDKIGPPCRVKMLKITR